MPNHMMARKPGPLHITISYSYSLAVPFKDTVHVTNVKLRFQDAVWNEAGPGPNICRTVCLLQWTRSFNTFT
jgi:hypothetical protein